MSTPTGDLLVARILEIANMRDDTDEGAIVEMPDEEDWGEIVGLARKIAQQPTEGIL